MKTSDSYQTSHVSNLHSDQPFFGAKAEQAFLGKGQSLSKPFFNPSSTPSAPIQTKLIVGAVGDSYEQEADPLQVSRSTRFAAEGGDHINHPVVEQGGDRPNIQRMGKEEEGGRIGRSPDLIQRKDEGKLQRRSVPDWGQRQGADGGELQMKSLQSMKKGNGLQVSPIVQRFGDEKNVKFRDSGKNAAINVSLLVSSNVLQRDIPTLEEWLDASRIPDRWIDWRTREMKAIGIALQHYRNVKSSVGAREKMVAINEILSAIANWRLMKAEKGRDEVESAIPDRKVVPKIGSHTQRKRSAFVDHLLDKVKTTIHEIMAEEQQEWKPDRFTSPEAVPQEVGFIYMINGIQEYSEEPAHITRVLSNPSSIRNAIISTSLVTDQKSAMWCPSGYVIRVPEANIVAASPTDTATQSALSLYHDVEIYREATRLYIDFGLPSPDNIVRDMKSGKHSEIVALGSTQSGDAKVVAIFIAVAPGESDYNQPIILATKAGEYKPPTMIIDGKRKTIAEKVPGVSEERMTRYRQTAENEHPEIPFVAIPMAEGSRFSKIGTTIWNDDQFITPEETKTLDWSSDMASTSGLTTEKN